MELITAAVEFHRVCDELRRDRLYGIRISSDVSAVLRESMDHSRVYLYSIGDGKCRAGSTGNDDPKTAMLLVGISAAELKGATRLTLDECRAELRRYTPTWSTLPGERPHISA
jgi:hypothetical protein